MVSAMTSSTSNFTLFALDAVKFVQLGYGMVVVVTGVAIDEIAVVAELEFF